METCERLLDMSIALDLTHLDLAGGFLAYCLWSYFEYNILNIRRQILWVVGTTSKPVCLAIRHLQIEKRQNSIESTWPGKPFVCPKGGYPKLHFRGEIMINKNQVIQVPISNHLNHFELRMGFQSAAEKLPRRPAVCDPTFPEKLVIHFL